MIGVHVAEQHPARLYLALQRSAPITLPPSAPAQFTFDLRFSMNSASSGTCSGCNQVVAITWLDATLWDSVQPIALLTNTFRDPTLMAREGRRLERWIDSLA